MAVVASAAFWPASWCAAESFISNLVAPKPVGSFGCRILQGRTVRSFTWIVISSTRAAPFLSVVAASFIPRDDKSCCDAPTPQEQKGPMPLVSDSNAMPVPGPEGFKSTQEPVSTTVIYPCVQCGNMLYPIHCGTRMGTVRIQHRREIPMKTTSSCDTFTRMVPRAIYLYRVIVSRHDFNTQRVRLLYGQSRVTGSVMTLVRRVKFVYIRSYRLGQAQEKTRSRLNKKRWDQC